MRAPGVIIFLSLALGLLAPRVFAASPEVQRILRNIDFEERRLGNEEDLPMHWVKLTGPGLPHYVNGVLATDFAHSGNYSFRLDLNGGSLIYRYEAGQIPVRPGGHYRVEGYVRTTVLENARVRMTAYLADMDGHPIEKTITHSELYAAKTPNEGWKKLVIELPVDAPTAASLVLEVGLLQPSIYAPNTLGDRALFSQDIRGSAWFDDIVVSQVPQVTLSTDRPGNIFRRSDPLRLTVVVNDRNTDDLAAQLVIKNALGKVVFQRSGALDMSTSKDLPTGSKQMILSLPDLVPGWYRAALVMTSQGTYVGEEGVDLVRLADDAPATVPDARFGIIATDLPYEGWDQLPRILPYLSAGRVKLAVWSQRGDIQQVDSPAFDSVLSRLQAQGITPTACLVDLPPSLSQNAPGNSWLQLLKIDPSVWRPQLAYMISRHANHLDRWQLGADGSDLFVSDPRMREVYKKVYDEFAELMDKPDLAMPWPAWYDLTGEMPATVALSVPPEVLPSQLPLYMQDIFSRTKSSAGGETHNLSLSLQLLGDSYGREEQIRDLAQRIVYALAGGASRIDLPLPFTVRRDGQQIVNEPKELLLIMRTMVTALRGTTFKGKVPIADGVDAFLFDRNGEGILVLWNRGSAGETKSLAVNLGQRPLRMDLWGNVSPLLKPDAKGVIGSGKVNLEIGPMPTILMDIDGIAAQLRASVTLDRPLIESSFEPHVRKIHFVNPSPTAVSGVLRLHPPQGWTINPPTFNFSLNPGEPFDREVTIEFPYNSFAGSKTIMAEFLMQGERDSGFSVPVTMHLGLSDVGMQTMALRDKNDVIVQQMITNYGEKPINYSAFAVYPGQARQERLVTNLAPGKTAVKLYRFRNVKIVSGAKVRTGIKELVGTRILNDEVPIQ